VYLSVASFVGHLQRRAVEERLKAHHARTAALEARLQMLQSQLQPHFLFNSLNVCAGLVHSSPDVAEATIDKLSAFLRYTLEASKEPMVPLARELEAVAAYLDIQRERFGDRLQHEIIVEGQLDDAPTLPPMLLQPLVENALLHGVGSAKGGSVRITCTHAGGSYTISIEDSGGGGGAPGTGTGQENVRERLRLLYGANAHLDCRATASGGYVAIVSLPMPATAHHPSPAMPSPA
jgi:LytS/YehU family sensor histidine kinase